jgi:signal transduction histidine kinase
VLEVQDEGIGFQERVTQGLGLISMRERAELVNGAIEFAKGEKGGVLVRITVPLVSQVSHA